MSCWNEIGTQGNATCPQLPVHGHCRDCPTFKAAAAQLLFDAPLGADDMAEVAQRLALEKRTVPAYSLSAVIFRAGGSWLALRTTSLQEIVNPRPIHSLPHRRNGAVLGLVNIRGELLVSIALPFILGLEAPPEAGHEPDQAIRRMLVARQDGARVVYPVDDVMAVERFRPEDCAPAPTMVAKSAAGFSQAVLSWRDTPVSLLDEKLLLAAVNRSFALATAI